MMVCMWVGHYEEIAISVEAGVGGEVMSRVRVERVPCALCTEFVTLLLLYYKLTQPLAAPDPPLESYPPSCISPLVFSL